MASNAQPSSVKVQNSFRQLTAAAANLNAATDELGKPVAELEAALKQLNLGVEVWATMESGHHPEAHEFWWSRDIGYAKVGGKWGIALRSLSGDSTDPGEDKEEEWLFSDAPRRMRILVIGFIPKLIEKMVVDINSTAERIREKPSEAKELANAVRGQLMLASKQK